MGTLQLTTPPAEPMTDIQATPIEPVSMGSEDRDLKEEMPGDSEGKEERPPKRKRTSEIQIQRIDTEMELLKEDLTTEKDKNLQYREKTDSLEEAVRVFQSKNKEGKGARTRYYSLPQVPYYQGCHAKIKKTGLDIYILATTLRYSHSPLLMNYRAEETAILTYKEEDGSEKDIRLQDVDLDLPVFKVNDKVSVNWTKAHKSLGIPAPRVNQITGTVRKIGRVPNTYEVEYRYKFQNQKPETKHKKRGDYGSPNLVMQTCIGTTLQPCEAEAKLSVTPVDHTDIHNFSRECSMYSGLLLEVGTNLNGKVDLTAFGLGGFNHMLDRYVYDWKTCGSKHEWGDLNWVGDTPWRIVVADLLIISAFERGLPMAADLVAEDIVINPALKLTAVMVSLLQRNTDEIKSRSLEIFEAAISAKYVAPRAMALGFESINIFLDELMEAEFPGVAKIVQSGKSEDVVFQKLIKSVYLE